MQAQRERFVKGAVARGVAQKKAAKIFELMEYFAGYGFNKSHSTTYALLAYHTAFLKANYPWHFMAALLTIESQNTDKLALYLGECRELGVPVLPPDINASELAFTVTGAGVRFGLGAVKNVGEGAIGSILRTRKEKGRIDSLFTLSEDVDLRLVNKRVLESLVKAGACDSLGVNGNGTDPPRLRSRLLAAVDRALEYGSRIQRDREKGQSQLFMIPDDSSGGEGLLGPMVDVPPLSEIQQLAYEKETLGLYLSGHPVERVAGELKRFGAKTTAELVASEADVAVGGIIAACRLLKTRKGDRMASFTLEDAYGNVEVVAFPEAYARAASLIEADAMVVVRGKLEKDEETTRLLASEVLPFSAIADHLTREVAIRLLLPPHGRATFEALADLFMKHRGDRPVRFELELRGRHPLRVSADVARIRVRPSERLRQEVEQICGQGTVSLR
jgi:DNA polymerase-3 subunit alpha